MRTDRGGGAIGGFQSLFFELSTGIDHLLDQTCATRVKLLFPPLSPSIFNLTAHLCCFSDARQVNKTETPMWRYGWV